MFLYCFFIEQEKVSTPHLGRGKNTPSSGGRSSSSGEGRGGDLSGLFRWQTGNAQALYDVAGGVIFHSVFPFRMREVTRFDFAFSKPRCIRRCATF